MPLLPPYPHSREVPQTAALSHGPVMTILRIDGRSVVTVWHTDLQRDHPDIAATLTHEGR